MADEKKAEVFEGTSKFVHLHLHTEYSALDGACAVGDIADRAKELGMEWVACTDHGNMQALPAFAAKLSGSGLKPILGCEIYLTDDRHQKHKDTKTYHLTLLAETTEGLKNLMKISSYAFIEGFYRKPRADYELLERYSEGIICLTGCMAAPTMSAIFQGDTSRARREVERLIKIFGKENIYGEIQNVGITEEIPADSELAHKLGKAPLAHNPEKASLTQNEANRELAEICADLGVKLVATGDVHYLRPDDAFNHDAMVCLSSGQVQKQDPRNFSLLPNRYHMRSEEEMRTALADWPEAIENTLEVARRCAAQIEYGKELLPKFPLPAPFVDSNDYLRHVVEEGLTDLLGTSDYPSEYRDRLEFELETIKSMGFPDYFLIVWDLFRYAHENGIPAGPGRGSAAGSIVAWACGITQLDPLKYGLLFERFLNPGRRSMPDIDMDFGTNVNGGREKVMQYAFQKYNNLAGCLTAVCQIVTFSKYQGKGGMKDGARVLAEPTDEGKAAAIKLGNRLSAAFPSKPPNLPLEDGIKESPDLQRMEKSEPEAKAAIDLARWLEGKIKTYSLHAAAVIIGDHPLEEDIPLQKLGDKAPLSTQWDMKYSEAVGLLKMDFLGLRNLDVIAQTLEKIKYVRGIDLGSLKQFYRTIPLDDVPTYELFARGDTTGTFQFESSGMRESLRLVKPTEFTDLVALVALYRPGPMQNIPHYAARKAGKEPVVYPDPRLEEILRETYSITVYQEQSMLIARELAGFTPAEADDLRKAIGKKLRDKMDALKKPFLEGCVKNGVPKKVAEELWDDNERAADYSFNKSHAACYAFISYMTGYLKAHYPEEYMASLLSSVMGDKDKPRLYLSEAKRMGLRVLPPDLNRSLRDFSVHEREDEPGQYDILFGMTAIKKVGDGVVAEIRDEVKRGGPFISLYDFARRMPGLSKTVVQQLARAGALDSTGATRKAMFDSAEDIWTAEKKKMKDAEKEFVNAVKARVEAEAAGGGAQLTFGGSLDADGGTSKFGEIALTEIKGKKTKVTAEGKTALEAAAKAAWARKESLPEEKLTEAILEALDKAAARDALKQAKVELQAQLVENVQVGGIASEEAGDEGDPLKERQQQLIDETAEERRQASAAYATQLGPFIAAEFGERAENAGLEAAMAAELDLPLPTEEWEYLDRLNNEREVLGIYVTGHPLDRDVSKWRRYVHKGLGELSGEDIGQIVRIVGAVVDSQIKVTKRGDKFVITTLEDLTGAQNVTFFSSALEGGLEKLLEVGQVVVVEGRVEEDTFQSQKNAEEAEAGHGDAGDDASTLAIRMVAAGPPTRWDPAKIVDKSPVVIEIPEALFHKEWVDQLREICAEHPGERPVKLKLLGQEKQYNLKMTVAATKELKGDLRALLQASRVESIEAKTAADPAATGVETA